MPFSAKQHPFLQHRNLMVDAAPLANQHSSCPHFARRRRRFHRTARSGIISYAIEHAADSWFETAERALLQAVCNCVSQQIPLHPHRRCGSVCRLPAHLQFVVAEASEIGDFGGESLVISPWDVTFHDCPPSNAGSHTHRSVPKLKPVLDAAMDAAMRLFFARHGSELR